VDTKASPSFPTFASKAILVPFQVSSFVYECVFRCIQCKDPPSLLLFNRTRSSFPVSLLLGLLGTLPLGLVEKMRIITVSHGAFHDVNGYAGQKIPDSGGLSTTWKFYYYVGENLY